MAALRPPWLCSRVLLRISPMKKYQCWISCCTILGKKQLSDMAYKLGIKDVTIFIVPTKEIKNQHDTCTYLKSIFSEKLKQQGIALSVAHILFHRFWEPAARTDQSNMPTGHGWIARVRQPAEWASSRCWGCCLLSSSALCFYWKVLGFHAKSKLINIFMIWKW